MSPENQFILGSTDQRSRFTKTMPAWVFALLRLLAFFQLVKVCVRVHTRTPNVHFTRETWLPAAAYCLSNAILTDYLITLVSVRVYVCPPIGCRTITSAILYRFSRNFARRSEIWLFRRVLFLRQTGNRLPILEMCKVRFWQFRDCGGHIFPRIVTKTPTEI